MVDDSENTGLAVTSRDYADCRVVSVAGRVDHTNFERFHEALKAEAETMPGEGGMVVDLSKLEFITSAGLRVLMLTHKAVSASGAKLVISGVGGVVKEVFRISKFDALLSVADTTGDAVGRVSDSAAEAFSG